MMCTIKLENILRYFFNGITYYIFLLLLRVFVLCIVFNINPIKNMTFYKTQFHNTKENVHIIVQYIIICSINNVQFFFVVYIR